MDYIPVMSEADRLWAINETGVDMSPGTRTDTESTGSADIPDTLDIPKDTSAYPKPRYNGAGMDDVVDQIAYSAAIDAASDKSEQESARRPAKANVRYKYTPDMFERIIAGIARFCRDVTRHVKAWLF